jgi:hypothetical protein
MRSLLGEVAGRPDGVIAAGKREALLRALPRSVRPKRIGRPSALLMALLTGVAIFLAACFWQKENIEGTFENRIDAVLCGYYDYADNAYAGGCPRELKPHTSAGWFFECGDSTDADKFPITVILAVKEGGRIIYQRTEECRVWQASGGKFLIEQSGDDLIVTDYIAVSTPIP